MYESFANSIQTAATANIIISTATYIMVDRSHLYSNISTVYFSEELDSSVSSVFVSAKRKIGSYGNAFDTGQVL